MPETQVGALRIAFEILGEGPRIVLTPGGRYGMGAGGVRELGQALAENGFSVLLWDRPNCGHSSVSFDAESESALGFTWAMPVMSRMDRIWEQRGSDLPHVRRRPSDYVREHVYFTTQPLEEVGVGIFREYMDVMDLVDNVMFSTDYPHWSFDAPTWAVNRFPADQRERIMRGNAMALYGFPETVKALPGERPRVSDAQPDSPKH